MTDVSITAGGLAPLVWELADELDASPAPALVITNVQTSAVETVVPVPGYQGSGVYSTVWESSTSQAAGSYTAVFSGKIDAVSVSSTIRVYVTSTTSYVSVAEFKDMLLPNSASTARDARIAGVLSGVSRSIDNECGRYFGTTARKYVEIDTDRNSTTRRQVGVLHIPDLAFPDDAQLTVQVGDGWTWTTVDPSDLKFDLENVISDVSIDSPAIAVLLRNRDWRDYGEFARIYARWGWPSIPPQAVEACHIQGTRIFARKGAPEGIAGPAEWGLTRQPRLDVDVRTMITGLQRAPIG